MGKRRTNAGKINRASAIRNQPSYMEPLEARVLLSVQTSVNVAMIGSSAVLNGGFLPVSGADLSGVTFTNLSPLRVTAAGLAPYDTAVLNVDSAPMAGTVNTLTAASKAALVGFVGSGHKLIIWDSETPRQNYSWLPFPFTTSNPGANGNFNGTLTVVEENTLSSKDPASQYYINTAAISSQTDAIGDANVMTSLDPHWKVDLTATNTKGVTGPVQTYAEYTDTLGAQGLIIYCGMDTDSMASSPNTNGSGMLRKIYTQEIRQKWDPSDLPGSVSVVGITLTPDNQQVPVDVNTPASSTFTATLADQLGKTTPDVVVTFTVLSGPNAGTVGTSKSDSQGKATFTYPDRRGAGTDTIEATFVNAKNLTIHSQTATQTWNGSPGITGKLIRYDNVPFAVTIKRWDPNDTRWIDPNATTWIVIHGRNSNSSADNFKRLAGAIDGFSDKGQKDQVLTLDWKDGALSSNIANQGEAAILQVAQWAAKVLAAYGFSGKNLNLVGHSWGSYVAYELAAKIPSDFGPSFPFAPSAASVNTIVGLDPARDVPVLYDPVTHLIPLNPQNAYNPDDHVNFNDVSRFSWAFHSSILGSDTTPATADESFNLMLISGITQDFSPFSRGVEAHSGAVDVFSRIVECNDPTPIGVDAAPNDVSKFFTLDRLLAHDRMFTSESKDGFEGAIQGTKVGNTNSTRDGKWEPLTFWTLPDPTTFSYVWPDAGANVTANAKPLTLTRDGTWVSPVHAWVGAADNVDWFTFPSSTLTKKLPTVSIVVYSANGANVQVSKPILPPIRDLRPPFSLTLRNWSVQVSVPKGSAFENSYYQIIVTVPTILAATPATFQQFVPPLVTFSGSPLPQYSVLFDRTKNTLFS